jgi:hypothetical protein
MEAPLRCTIFPKTIRGTRRAYVRGRPAGGPAEGRPRNACSRDLPYSWLPFVVDSPAARRWGGVAPDVTPGAWGPRKLSDSL